MIAYDPLGRLHQTAYPTWTRFEHVGAALITELNNSNVVQRRYVYGPGMDEPLVWYEGSGTSSRRWLHADERGSIVAVSDGSGDLYGTRNRYDDYGMPQGTLTGRFGFTGQPWIPELSLYQYRARTYNPALGRFMQTDPIGYEAGMNLYAYVRNDPVNLVDPFGLDIVVVGPEPDRGYQSMDFPGNVGRSPARMLTPGPTLDPDPEQGGGPCCGGGAGAGDSYAEADPEDPNDPDNEIVVQAPKEPSGLGAAARNSSYPRPNAVYFGYPPEANSRHHIERHLRRLTTRQRRLLRRLVGQHLRAHAPRLQPTQSAIGVVTFMGREYEYRAYGLPGGITSIGTIFDVTE